MTFNILCVHSDRAFSLTSSKQDRVSSLNPASACRRSAIIQATRHADRGFSKVYIFRLVPRAEFESWWTGVLGRGSEAKPDNGTSLFMWSDHVIRYTRVS